MRTTIIFEGGKVAVDQKVHDNYWFAYFAFLNARFPWKALSNKVEFPADHHNAIAHGLTRPAALKQIAVVAFLIPPRYYDEVMPTAESVWHNVLRAYRTYYDYRKPWKIGSREHAKALLRQHGYELVGYRVWGPHG